MKSLNEFTKNFSINELENVFEIRDEFFLVNPEIKSIIDLIGEKPYSAGIPLGKKGREFKPSLILLDILSATTHNKVFVNDKAEWLFLCHRDVFLESITKDLSRRDVFLVQNSRDENLGFGRKAVKGKKNIVVNLLDRGDFLRRER